MRSLCRLFSCLLLANFSFSYAAPIAAPVAPQKTTPSKGFKEAGKQTIHQYDRFLMVFHFEEDVEFDEVGNLGKRTTLFGTSSIEINPTFVTNQHSSAGITQSKTGMNQVMVLETPINEASVAAIHFLETTPQGINIVSIYEIEEKKNVFRCFYSRLINTTDHKAGVSNQILRVNKGFAYPINEAGEHILE